MGEREQSESRQAKSKARDKFLGIKPYNFFSYEQFGVTPDYMDKSEEATGRTACWYRCYREVWNVFDTIADNLGQRPPDGHVMRQLDEGHASFYEHLRIAKEQGNLTDGKLDEAFSYWSMWFIKWQGWFRKH